MMFPFFRKTIWQENSLSRAKTDLQFLWRLLKKHRFDFFFLEKGVLQDLGYGLVFTCVIGLCICRKQRRSVVKKVKFLFSWTLGTCWRFWRKSSSSRTKTNLLFCRVRKSFIINLRVVSDAARILKCTCSYEVGGGLPVVHKASMTQKKPEKFAHNPLDSTSPLVKKGKQREVPKPKKPTALKKVRFLYKHKIHTLSPMMWTVDPGLWDDFFSV